MNKQVVLITGCSTGIGRALAKEFYAQDFRVAATARKPESIVDLKGKGILTFALDVTVPDQMDQVIRSVVDREKRIDILVNNAGYGLMGPTIEIPEEELELQFRTNVTAQIIMAQKVAPVMKELGGGKIYNISSISGMVPTPFSGGYCASKAALHTFSEVLRMELSPFGIQVISVQPGGIRTRFGANADARAARILKKDSWYLKLEEQIKMRAGISQIDATPAEYFARKLVAVALKGKQPAILRIGKRSTTLPLMKRLSLHSFSTGSLNANLALINFNTYQIWTFQN